MNPSAEVIPFVGPSTPQDTMNQRREAALNYCDSEIKTYADVGTSNSGRWRVMQTATLLLGATAILLCGFESQEYGLYLKIARAAFVAFTTIAAGLTGTFSYQKESVRQLSTRDMLVGERIKFTTGSKPYDNETTSVSDFVNKVRDIISTEN